MSEVHKIVKQLQRTFQGRAFHGPAVDEALEGVTAKMAAARSPGGAHNIWQIVEHMTFWQDTARRWLQGDRTRPEPGTDWKPVEDKSDGAWRKALWNLDRSNELLRDEVMLLDESRIEEPIFDGFAKTEVVLRGIVQHNVYHAGQISLLKKMQS
jgi:DinB superfamily